MSALSNKLILLAALLFLFSCEGRENAEADSWAVPATFQERPADSLLTDMITYIYKKPKTASRETKFTEKYRPYYINALAEFDWLYYSQQNDEHYYYIIRPARSSEGNNRGVAGVFKLDEKGGITSFKETLNTPVLAEDALKDMGKVIFDHLINNEIDTIVENRQYTDFPDNRVWYDESIHEWSYHQKQ